MGKATQGQSIALLLLCLFCAPRPVHAKNLGVFGPVFPIGEIDMLDWIDNRLRTFEQNGEIDAMKQRMQARVKNSVMRPPPVQGLNTTTTPNTYYIDPTLTLAAPVKDSLGNELYPKGTRVNPFDSTTWPAAERQNLPRFTFSKQLVLFDGDDPRQRQWAQQYAAPLPVKWILTNGEPAALSKKLDSRVYFDQQGKLTREFHVKHVPVVISQSGTRWQVTEIDVSAIKED